MDPTLAPRAERKKRPSFAVYLLVALLLSFAITAGVWYIQMMPNQTKVAPFPQSDGKVISIAFQGTVTEGAALAREGEILLSMDWLKEHVDPMIYRDEPTNSVIITTENKVLQLRNNQVEAFVNDKPFTLRFPVEEAEGKIFVPVQPLDKLYPLAAKLTSDGQAAVVNRTDFPVQLGKVLPINKKETTVAVRTDATHKAPWVAEVSADEEVEVHGEKAGWYLVQMGDGISGYMDKKYVSLSGIRMGQPLMEQKEVIRSKPAWSPLGGKINLVWEHVHSKNPAVGEIPSLPGVNVISPTWFSLVNEQGHVASKAHLPYVKWAHDRGYQVWALFSNNFDPDLTQAVIGNYELRQKMIRQLLEYATLYDLDGINIDFENVYLQDKANLVQFVRELTPYLHDQGLVVSIDVTIKSLSETWSLFYDRKALAETVDYMMVMTYDEHWAGSPKSGSVASLPWVEKGLKGVLEEVPNHKLLLGVPFYTRLWQEEKDDNGNIKVSAKAYSMGYIEEWLAARNLQPVLDAKSGQMYAEWRDDKGTVFKVWLENEGSMAKRAQLVKKYDLAGIAAWRRGFELPGTWQTIKTELEKLPY